MKDGAQWSKVWLHWKSSNKNRKEIIFTGRHQSEGGWNGLLLGLVSTNQWLADLSEISDAGQIFTHMMFPIMPSWPAVPPALTLSPELLTATLQDVSSLPLPHLCKVTVYVLDCEDTKLETCNICKAKVIQNSLKWMNDDSCMQSAENPLYLRCFLWRAVLLHYCETVY